MALTTKPIKPEDLDFVRWRSIVAEESPLDDHEVADAYWKAAQDAERRGSVVEANVYCFISTLMFIRLNLDCPGHPFQARMRFGASRTAAGDDIEDTEFDLIRKLAGEASNLALSVRCYDLLWTYKREYRAAESAVAIYLRIADIAFDPEHWCRSADSYRRALQIGCALGNNHSHDTAVRAARDAVIRLDGTDPLFFTATLIEFLLEYTDESLGDLAHIVRKAADVELVPPNWRRRVELLRTLSRVYLRDERKVESRQCLIQIAETYVAQYEAEENASAVQAKNRLERAIEAYRTAGKCEIEIQSILGILNDVQRRIPGELKLVTTKIDLSNLVQEARHAVDGKSLSEALRSFCRLLSPPRRTELYREAQELSEEFVVRQIFSKVIVGSGGRKIAVAPAAVSSSQGQIEASLEADVMSDLTRRWFCVAHGHIDPAIRIIQRQHQVAISDMREFTMYNPLIPQGFEETYMLGLWYGFSFQFAEAVSLLLPAFENSLRHILEVDGITTCKFDKEGVQDPKSLNALFALNSSGGHREDLEARLGEDLVFELRALLTERFGANLRNEHAHGLIRFAEYFAPSSMVFWGKVLHLVIVGASSRDGLATQQEEPQNQSVDAITDATKPMEDPPND